MSKSVRNLVAIVLCASHAAAAQDQPIDFARDVLPIFRAKCFSCHGPKTTEGGLRLDTRRRALLGGDSGSTIIKKESSKSELITRITAEKNDGRMPPKGEPLSNRQIDTLRRWVDDGAKWPDKLAGEDRPSQHWAFRRIDRPTVPDAGVENPIDAFIISKLKAHKLSPSKRADRSTLIRRLYLDLIGLPPSPEAVHRFLNDRDDNAYAKVVDELLSSKHFGERWARHWLDLARFAESDGYENDRIRSHAFRYRDWVIDAINNDLPFDQFTVDQLAGDLMPDATDAQKIATGFHRNTLWNSAASADKEEFRVRAIKDRTETTGTVWMGLTLRCCQCHSHKYDPIAQREYYSMYAFFNRTDNNDTTVGGRGAQTLKSAKRDSFVHRRGNFLSRGPKVEPRTPAFLPKLETRGQQPDRLDLARWLVNPDHPLTARVAVNRYWQHLFRQGIVPSPENFGQNGEQPTHPELLDWLASEFIRLNWSRKKLIRTIVMSATYQQSSHQQIADCEINGTTNATCVDPPNRLLWRQNRLRVEAEIVRDLALSVSGLLNLKMHGPSIVPPFPKGLGDFRLNNETLRQPGGGRFRRGIYIHVQRTFTFPTLAAFDAADGNEACVRRDRSNTPMQALTLLNDPVFNNCTSVFGKRIQRLGENKDERLTSAFEICFAREPSTEEMSVLHTLVQSQKDAGADEDEIWRGVARTMLNLEAFITRE